MSFTPEQIKQLSDVKGVANDMGDFFVPNDCLECILVRRGYMKYQNGRKWFIMIATKMTGSLNLELYSKPDEFSSEPWNNHTSISSGGFSNFVSKYILKN